MRQLELKPSKIMKGSALADLKSKVELHRLQKSDYALVKRQSGEVLFAFQSSALSRFLKSNKQLIHGVSLHEVTCKTGSEIRMHLELRLRLGNDTLVIINEFERVFVCHELKAASGDPKTLRSPYGIWNMIPEPPLVNMLITSRLMDYIDDMCDGSQQRKHLLMVLWQEHTIAVQKTNQPGTMKIEGEFMAFTATPLNQNMVAFDTNQ